MLLLSCACTQCLIKADSEGNSGFITDVLIHTDNVIYMLGDSVCLDSE